MRTRALMVGVLFLAAAGLFSLGGCKKQEKQEAKIKIGFVVKQPDEAWFVNEQKFAQRCADKYGFDVVPVAATDGEKALAVLDNLGAQGAQGVVIATPDVRLGPALVARAKANGLKLFSVDDQWVGSDGQFMDVPYMGISATDIGTKVGEALAEEMKKRNWPAEETAAVAITFDHVNTCKQRTDAAAAALVKAGFPADKIYREPSKQGDVPSAMDAGNILLTKHPEVKRWLVFSSNDEGVLGVVRALESSGRGFGAENVIGIGIGGSTCAAEFKKPQPTGFYATCLISPKRHGYETTEYVYKWIKDGAEPPKYTLTQGIMVTRQTFDQVSKEEGLAD